MDEKQLKQFYKSIYQHLNFLNDVALNANGDATVKLITETINKYSNSEFIKKCVAVINSISKDEFEFCRKLFEISCALVKYRRDPDGHEIVFTPQLLIRVREGDCKKFTTWICAVLKCRGIASASKVVNYDEEFGWQHIYAIAWPKDLVGDRTTILDPVNYERFNQEVRYRVGRINFYDGTYSKLIMAKLSIMGNVPAEVQNAADSILGDLEDISGKRRRRVTAKCIQGIEDDYIHGVYDSIEAAPDDDSSIAAKRSPAKSAKKAARKEVRKEKKTVRVEKRKKVAKKLKGAGFAPARKAFIGLIILGAALKKTGLKINLAENLAKLWQKDNGASIKAMWAKFGGKDDEIKKAIIKASHLQISGFEGEGMGSVAAAAALITAAAPILVVSVKLLHDKKVMSKEEALRTTEKTEGIEEANTDKNGNLLADVTAIVKSSATVLDAVQKADSGGDREVQQTIKTTPTTNDPNPTAPVHTDGDGSGKDNAAPSASGFSLTNASSYFTGSITVQLMGIALNIPTAGTLAGIALLAIGTILTIKKSFLKSI